MYMYMIRFYNFLENYETILDIYFLKISDIPFDNTVLNYGHNHIHLKQ